VPPDLEFRPVAADEGDGALLIGAMVAEMRELYWDIGAGLDLDSPDMPKAGPAELGPPHGLFLVGYQAGAAVCAGGLKRLPEEGACELKRMYVVPSKRGQGLARALLQALEDAARAMGYGIARLDTGHRQGHAQGLYESEGYRAIPNFNGNPVATFFGEKQL
jgi:GNAT superfamily N-acetyltransferase